MPFEGSKSKAADPNLIVPSAPGPPSVAVSRPSPFMWARLTSMSVLLTEPSASKCCGNGGPAPKSLIQSFNADPGWSFVMATPSNGDDDLAISAGLTPPAPAYGTDIYTSK